MKKNILRMFVVFALVLSCSLCLVACGNADKKKEEEIVGKYQTAQVEVTFADEEATTSTYTKEQYEALVEKEDKTREEEYLILYLEDFFVEYEVKNDHNVYAKNEDGDQKAIATWKYENDKLIVEAVEKDVPMEFSGEYKDSKLYITITSTAEEPEFTSAVLTLEKIVA